MNFKQMINHVNEQARAKQKYTVKPRNKKELKEIIDQTIAQNGDKCNLNFIDTSLIDDMRGLFKDYKNFDGDISKWNVSNVELMDYMFEDAASFNQDISNWDVSNVKYMNWMFKDAVSFNQDISNWDVSKIGSTKMQQMFTGATSFSYIDQVRNKWLSNRRRTPNSMFKGAGI